MQRYYVKEAAWQDNIVILTDEDAHHIKRVMRQQIGDELICNHPNGEVAHCSIIEMNDNDVKVQILEWLSADSELPVHVTIVQGLPKGNKLELIFQKGTELGAAAFQLFEADRSVAKWDEKKTANRFKRYNKIIKEASEQCHRSIMPELHNVRSLKQILLESDTYDYVLFGYEEAAKQQYNDSFSNILKKVHPGQSILFVIGPEGGFSKEEVELLESYGAHSVRLGKRILRTETASLYALASISYHFEEWKD